MARIRIDATPAVCLAYCTCGWRELAATRDGARRVAAWHEQQVHPQQEDARKVLDTARRRARMSGSEGDNQPHADP